MYNIALLTMLFLSSCGSVDSQDEAVCSESPECVFDWYTPYEIEEPSEEVPPYEYEPFNG